MLSRAERLSLAAAAAEERQHIAHRPLHTVCLKLAAPALCLTPRLPLLFAQISQRLVVSVNTCHLPVAVAAAAAATAAALVEE